MSLFEGLAPPGEGEPRRGTSRGHGGFHSLRRVTAARVFVFELQTNRVAIMVHVDFGRTAVRPSAAEVAQKFPFAGSRRGGSVHSR